MLYDITMFQYQYAGVGGGIFFYCDEFYPYYPYPVVPLPWRVATLIPPKSAPESFFVCLLEKLLHTILMKPNCICLTETKDQYHVSEE